MVVSKMSCANIKWRTGSITIVHIYYIVAIVDPSFTTREGDATKIVSRLFFAGDHAQLTIMLTITQATMLKKRKHKMKRCNTEPQVYKYKYILELLHISLFVCACLFVQHRATGILKYNKVLIFQCMAKKCLMLTQGDTFRRFLKLYDFSKLFAFSKILEFLFCRCWRYHFVLLHRQPSQTLPHHRFFQSPVSNCPHSLCLCLIRKSFFYDN